MRLAAIASGCGRTWPSGCEVNVSVTTGVVAGVLVATRGVMVGDGFRAGVGVRVGLTRGVAVAEGVTTVSVAGTSFVTISPNAACVEVGCITVVFVQLAPDRIIARAKTTQI